MKKVLAVALVAMTLMPVMASAQRMGGGRGYGGGFGYGGYGYGYSGFGYGPYWGGPYFGGPYFGGYGVFRPTMGGVKFDTPEKGAFVWVNGAYAGTVAQVKTLRLQPGTYTIQVTMAGRATFEQRVYITYGHTVKLRPELAPVGGPPPMAPVPPPPPAGGYAPQQPIPQQPPTGF